MVNFEVYTSARNHATLIHLENVGNVVSSDDVYKIIEFGTDLKLFKRGVPVVHLEFIRSMQSYLLFNLNHGHANYNQKPRILTGRSSAISWLWKNRAQDRI